MSRCYQNIKELNKKKKIFNLHEDLNKLFKKI